MSPKVCVNENLCKGCNICVEFCPKGVFAETDKIGPRGYYVPVVADSAACSACMLCEHLCPELAITVVGTREKLRRDGGRPGGHALGCEN